MDFRPDDDEVSSEDSPTDSRSRFTSNLSADRGVIEIAGGTFLPDNEYSNLKDGEGAAIDSVVRETIGMGTLFPETVRVSFPSWTGGDHDIDVAFEDAVSEVNIESYFGATTGSVLHIESTCLWAQDSDTRDATADLAQVIAENVMLSLEHRYDRTMAGVVDWQMTGYDDCLTVSFLRRPDDSYEVHTRVQTVPYNLGVRRLGHQNSGINLARETWRGTWDDDAVFQASWAKDRFNGVGIYAECADRQVIGYVGIPAAGTFTLTFNGDSTSALAANASAAVIETALNALNSIIADGGVTCESGGADGLSTRPVVTITFDGHLGTASEALPLIQVNSAAVTDGGLDIVRDVDLLEVSFLVFNPFATFSEDKQCHVVRVGRRFELSTGEC
jgi:hypothetical protein